MLLWNDYVIVVYNRIENHYYQQHLILILGYRNVSIDKKKCVVLPPWGVGVYNAYICNDDTCMYE